MTRREANSQTKQYLMDAFWSLYCEKRIEKITVKEITQKAGYNRSTFYEYFIDVYDVLEQIEQSIIPTIDELPPISVSPEKLDMPLTMFLQLYEQQQPYYSVLLGDHGDPAFVGKLKQSIKPLLKEAFKNDVTIDEIEFDFVLEFTLSAMIGIMSYWFKQDKALPPERLISLIYNLMENGIANTIRK